MPTFLRFRPIYQERVWGGRGLETFLGRKLPGSARIGESWELVDRDEAQSIIGEGPWQGRTLRDLLSEHGPELMGPGWRKHRRFPILVKWLDCRERLSLQVHPPASVASQLGGEPKTENWYVAHAEPGAAVLAGLKPGVTSAQFRAALGDETAERLVDRLPTRPGDSLLIRSGVMHAIDAGNIILEIQQNSDTTYRVFDWGRLGLDGKPRTLHIEQSLISLEANTASAPKLERVDARTSVLAECPEFRITGHRLDRGEQLALTGLAQARILSMAEGNLEADGDALCQGDNVILPFGRSLTLRAKGRAVLLVTDNFSSLENPQP